MKKFLKTVAVLAALALALACIVGCKNNSKGEEEKKNLTNEYKATVEDGTLNFAFYDDNTFEYKETVGEKSGEISGTYSKTAEKAALALGNYKLKILKIVGEFLYAKDLTEGGAMTVSISNEGFSVEEIKNVEFKVSIKNEENNTPEENTEDENPDDDYTVEGPWQDVTDLNDLVGVWLCRYKRSQKYNDNFTFAGKEYNNCAVAEEVDHFFEWKISNENGYIMTEINKKGSYDTQTITFPTPITDEEVAAIRAENEEDFNKDWHEADSEFWKVVYAVTNTKWFNKESCIKDCPSDDTFSLKMEEGKCCFYYYGNLYIKINEAKNGIQIFDKDTILYTAKKQ